MQQQQTPTDEEWLQVSVSILALCQLVGSTIYLQLMQLFSHAEGLSNTTAEEPREDEDQEIEDSDQDPENLETIWTDAIQGVEIFDPQEATDVRQEPENGQQSQPQSTFGGVIGSSSLHRQVIDQQGNIVMVCLQNVNAVCRVSDCFLLHETILGLIGL